MAGKNGGARRGAGRPPGKISQHKRELMEMAKGHAEEALQALVWIAKNGENDSARVSAAIAILDRGYGKPVQAVQHSGDPDGKPMEINWIVKRA